ncbi:hypothetical protein BMS3Bbin15_01695 [archaeon BMS3Bbin15]|nr:hypothetical protein BMS3Bbin15_01695 [archaeon BMS3Bbin15]
MAIHTPIKMGGLIAKIIMKIIVVIIDVIIVGIIILIAYVVLTSLGHEIMSIIK